MKGAATGREGGDEREGRWGSWGLDVAGFVGGGGLSLFLNSL